jgi:hypothetical protein
MDTAAVADIRRLAKIRDELELAVRLSKGWWRQISRDTGCRYHTLERFAGESDYDISLSELSKIDGWFLIHGIPRKAPARRADREPLPTLNERQQDAFAGT